MRIFIILLILSISSSAQVKSNSTYDFKVVFDKDQTILSHNHGCFGEIQHLREFKQFKKINFKNYTRTSLREGNYDIERWLSKSNNIKSITKISADISCCENSLVHFIAFEFILKNNKTYTYISVLGQGLMQYTINQIKYKISYESIIFGLDTIYFETKSEIEEKLSKI